MSIDSDGLPKLGNASEISEASSGSPDMSDFDLDAGEEMSDFDLDAGDQNSEADSADSITKAAEKTADCVLPAGRGALKKCVMDKPARSRAPTAKSASLGGHQASAGDPAIVHHAFRPQNWEMAFSCDFLSCVASAHNDHDF